MLRRAFVFTGLALTASHASFPEFMKSLQYGFTYHWGGLSPYGDDDANQNGQGDYWDPSQPTANSTTDFDDVFGQPRGHAHGAKLTMLHKGRYGLRIGYETTGFRTDLNPFADTSLNWKVRKNDISTEVLWGKPFGTPANNFFPYIFGGLSVVYYGEEVESIVDGTREGSNDPDILSTVVGLNFGGGLKLNLFRHVDVGVEVWHQAKDFATESEPQPDGKAKELNARLLFGVHFGPFGK